MTDDREHSALPRAAVLVTVLLCLVTAACVSAPTDGGTDPTTTVGERNPETGVADLLQAAEVDGLVEFGAHLWHEPTYLNRSTSDLDSSSTWAEVVTAVEEYISCEKDPVLGGCIAESGGGIVAVQENLGSVEALSGVPVKDGALLAFEGGAGVHAISRYLPDRMVGFGFADHGALVQQPGYVDNVVELMELLAPSAGTSGTVFWADDVIRLNDRNFGNDEEGPAIESGADELETGLAEIDRTVPQVQNIGFASKYIYTASGASPTVWAYSHSDDPELPECTDPDDPDCVRNTDEEIEENYTLSESGLEALADALNADTTGSSFVSPSDIIELVAPADYWIVSPDDLDVMARWLILGWDEGPPDWVSDGTDFYSLRDLFGVLSRELSMTSDGSGGGGADLDLGTFYGPLSDPGTTDAVTLPSSEVLNLATEAASIVESTDAIWQATPSNIMPASYESSVGTISAAQLLYAMATVYAADQAGSPVTEVHVPAGSAMPIGTYPVLQAMGCDNCTDSAWSLKPARIVSDT